MKRPSFQFYPGDWLRDTALRSCSVGARGLWTDMLCLMHEGTPYGFLKVNHKVILTPNLARMVGATLPETEGWVHELEAAGVFSRDDEGCIFSRRMIRDETIRQARACGGKLGGNPALKDKHKVNLKVENKVNLLPNLPPTPSSASASSSAFDLSPLVPHDDGNRADPPPRRVRQKKAKEDVSDEQWLADLGKAPCYAHCDVPMQHAKAAKWCEVNRRNFTRKFFLNWLNRIEAPLKGGTTTKPRTWQPDPTDPEAF
jgi:hypothetical protein